MRVSLKVTNTLVVLIMNAKLRPTDLKEDSGLYKLFCLDCEAIYIGETGRRISTGIKQYVSNNDV